MSPELVTIFGQNFQKISSPGFLSTKLNILSTIHDNATNAKNLIAMNPNAGVTLNVLITV